MKLNERGFTLAGALTIIAILAIFWALTLPLWARIKQRDNEEELIFRGNEYVRAIGRYHQKFGTYPPDLETLEKLKYIRKLYKDPMTKSGKWKVLHMDALVQTGAAGQINVPGQRNSNRNDNGNSRFEDEEDDEENDSDDDSLFGDLEDDDDEEEEAEEAETESAGPIVGVVSRSKKDSIKIYNGMNRYNKWKFIYSLQQQQGQQPRGVPNPNQQPGGRGNRNPGSSNQGNNNPDPPPVSDEDDDS